ncbi:TCR/Tet family MFS transporter [Kaistia dalseonensis]|nr:TCR/Tet family MFS transporter [Kaistia dalseonensis]
MSLSVIGRLCDPAGARQGQIASPFHQAGSIMNRGLFVVLAAVTLDAVGIGLIMPILPGLLRDLSGHELIANQYGVLIALYALMQFIFAPIVGILSDRFGRKPVLLVSLAAAAIDYALMALSPSLWFLYVGRIVSGIASANAAVASAYIADVTPPDERGRRFGWMNACFGLGFVAGPALGGWLGEYSARAPFWLAMALNSALVLAAMVGMPARQPASAKPFDWKAVNPFASLSAALSVRTMLPLMAIFVIVQMVGQIGGVLWVIHGQDRYGWSPAISGLTLALFGILHAVVQGVLTGPVIRRLGERGAFAASVAIDAVAFVCVGLASQGWMAIAAIPLLCLGGMEQPALQALFSRQTSEERQGELQGLLASLSSLAGVISTIGVTALYAATAPSALGLVWIVGACLYLFCLPIFIRGGRRARLERGSTVA